MTKKIISVIFAMIIIFALKNYSNAANATIQCSNTAKTNTPITISVSGSAVQWNLYLKVNGKQIASNSELDNVNGNKTISFSGNYTPTAEGNLTITLEGSVTEASDGSTIKSFNSKTIAVQATNDTSASQGNQSSGQTSQNPNPPTTVQKSNIATLSNLGIRPNDFKGFKANTTSYNVTVPNTVESIEVYANKGQSGQTISGIGKKTLKEGVNTINVVVTAEDRKTQKTYTLNVTRQKAGENEPETEPKEEPEETGTEKEEVKFGLSELNIEGFDLDPEFDTNIYEYKIELTQDIDKLNLSTLALNENSEIEIIGNENLQDGENIITIIVKDQNGDTVAYQITVNKNIERTETNEENQQEKIKIIILISIVVAVILIIIISFIIFRKRKSRSSEYEMYYSDINDSLDDEEQKEDVREILNKMQEFENFEEKPKKKKRSKGKRFK